MRQEHSRLSVCPDALVYSCCPPTVLSSLDVPEPRSAFYLKHRMGSAVAKPGTFPFLLRRINGKTGMRLACSFNEGRSGAQLVGGKCRLVTMLLLCRTKHVSMRRMPKHLKSSMNCRTTEDERETRSNPSSAAIWIRRSGIRSKKRSGTRPMAQRAVNQNGGDTTPERQRVDQRLLS